MENATIPVPPPVPHDPHRPSPKWAIASASASTAPNSRTGFIERYIKLYDAEATELTAAAGARELAAALLRAADAYDGVPRRALGD